MINIGQFKKLKIEGVTYTIRKLSPDLFLDKEYMYPISNYQEIGDSIKDKDVDKAVKAHDDFNDKIIDIIERSVLSVRKLFKKNNIADIIEDIKKDHLLMYRLFNEIISFTFGVKKNSIYMK